MGAEKDLTVRIVKTTADNTRHMQKSFKGQRSLRERFYAALLSYVRLRLYHLYKPWESSSGAM